MLDSWLKQTNPSPSWEAIVEALESDPVSEGCLAEEVNEKYCSPQLGHSTDRCRFLTQQECLEMPETHIQKYIKHLKALYVGSSLPPMNKWPPTPSRQYINLACIDKRTVTKDEAKKLTESSIYGKIDDIFLKKTAISMEDVACKKDIGYPQLVLVGGAPGVGKTTFAWELCRRWACGELLQDYSGVFILRLRDKYTRKAKKLANVILYPEKEQILNEISKKAGEGFLFILEGFDELPENMRIDSMYVDMICGNFFLSSVTVLVTSRPWAIADFDWKYHHRISQRIEILGFTKLQIDEYLISVSSNDTKLLSELRRYVSLNPPIYAAMYVPLNAAIVVEVYKDRRNSDSIIPNTMTELYTAYSLTLLIRYLDDSGERIGNIHSFEDLPPEVYKKFFKICKIANEGINNNQQLIFTDLADDFETLGFMQSVPELHFSTGVSVTYNFPHLTIQEFLAAYYLSTQSMDVQEPHVQNSKPGKFLELGLSSSASTVVRFLAGITRLNNPLLKQHLPIPDSELQNNEIYIFAGSRSRQQRMRSVTTKLWQFDKEKISISSKTYNYVPSTCDVGRNHNQNVCVLIEAHVNLIYEGMLYPYHTWLYESQNTDVLQVAIGVKSAFIEITNNMTPMECFAAGWCIGNSNCEWKLFFHGLISLDHIDMLCAGMNNDDHSQFRICELYIGEGVIFSDPEALKRFADLPSTYLSKLVCCSATKHDGVRRHDSLVSTLVGLIANSSHLKEISLTHDSISDLKVLTPLRNAYTTLVTLDLTCSELPSGSGVELTLLLKETTSLKILILTACRMVQHILISTIEAVKTNETLQTLDLSANDYGERETEALMDMLRVNQTLQVLRLCGSLSCATTPLLKVFTNNHNRTLLTLDIRDNCYVVEEVAEMLQMNTSLQSVEITVTPLFRPGNKYHGNTVTFYSQKGVMAYVSEKETINSICSGVVAAVNKSGTLQQLVIHTKNHFVDTLESTIMNCLGYHDVQDKVDLRSHASTNIYDIHR